MFCSNCGAELGVSNQKFCHNCGTEVIALSKTTSYKTERIQTEAPPKTQYEAVRPQYAPVRPQYAPVRPQRQLQRGEAGKFSKLCLGLALASIVIGIVSLVIGYNSMRFFMWPYYNPAGRIVVMIVMLLMRVGGLVMGVFSKVNSSKAEIFEPFNDVERAGSIFGIFGIIVNGIGIALSFLGPWSLFTIPIYM
ncbi:MAG: zinc-ribbon domain-containing protein [Promethearchaeota archaeon]|jgi:hypothetical protein